MPSAIACRLEAISNEIVTLYKGGQSVNDLSVRYGVSDTPLKRLLRAKGVMRSRMESARQKCTKYEVNERFFETIDTLEKCWMLGWFYTDGYNSEKAGDVRISLNDKDEEVLVKMSRLIGSTRPLQREPSYRRSTLIVTRRKMSEDLARVGCTQAKSFTIEYPHAVLDTRAKNCAFLRGVIEGDGCIHISRKPSRQGPYVGLTIASASPRFVEALGRIFEEYWGLTHYVERRAGRGIVSIRFRGCRDKMKAMLTEIYDQTSFGLYLDRKYTQYQEAIILLDQLLETHYQRRPVTRHPVAGVYLVPNPLIMTPDVPTHSSHG